MPKEKMQLQVRVPTRRAASKEALKQMQILLGDERNQNASSDDDVIEVEVQPPKKKYKLSHRKSSDGNDRDVIVLKTVTNDENIFDLEVTMEDLTPAQKARKAQIDKEEKELEEKIDQLIKNPNTEIIYTGVYTSALEISEELKNVSSTPSVSVTAPNILIQKPNTSTTLPQSYQLVMDPRSGVIVGAVSTPSTAVPPLVYQPKVVPPTTATATNEQVAKARRSTPFKTGSTVTTSVQKTSVQPNKTLVSQKLNTPKGIQVKNLGRPVQMKMPSQANKPTIKLGQATTTHTVAFRPSESNVEGGLSLGAKQTSIDLTGEDGKALPDSREVSFNKLQGRTYPSLVVVARPHLRVKDLASDRGKLDVKVKSVLMYPPTKFTEWLIQQGLVRSEQKCSKHPTNQLKLGMYSDATKFPYSGGYVWISECCPQRFVSVFNGSIFEGSRNAPMSVLKLLYHWCCQTIVQNVTQWVKVDNLFVKGMYTALRGVCTVALQTHIKQLGGPGVRVQVGVISLGTTSQDGNKREVKVEVLGILETASRHLRLRAVEPLPDGERNYKKRFTKILEPVAAWVHPASTIVTDLTVDKSTLHEMGFQNISQSTSTDYNNSNRTIMEYLRRIVPRMFQNTLSLLSRQIIQQFLDELVWREWYGTTVLQAFDNMIVHISQQTRYDSGQSLINRLNKVSANPFKNWAISTQPNNNNTAQTVTAKQVPEQSTSNKRPYNRVRKPATPQLPSTNTQEIMRPAKSTSPDVPEQMVPLENYYYGTIDDIAEHSKPKITLNIKCALCKSTFNNNIMLMNHLFKHAHNISDEVQLCKYCLTIVPTAQDLLKHISSSHPDETKFDNGFVCLICEAHFRNPFILGKHMSREHCPSELPYACGSCHYRCSNHKQIIDHFYLQHDSSSMIQCPFCLKGLTIYSGRNITQNLNHFVEHLQKHQKKQLAKRCGKCTLWFVKKESLREHQIKQHVSQRGKPGLVPTYAPRNGVMVPKSKMDKCPDDAKLINFSTLYFNVPKNLNCKECNKPLSNIKHFGSFESCQNPNCQYSTCCSISMQEHVTKCRSLNSKIPTEKLPYEMFCVCGYSDTCGNLMAKHLAICERKSAYPSIDASKAATVTHSMLDVLGLVRKPDESNVNNRDSPVPSEKSSKKSDDPDDCIAIEDDDKSNSDKEAQKDETVTEIVDSDEGTVKNDEGKAPNEINRDFEKAIKNESDNKNADVEALKDKGSDTNEAKIGSEILDKLGTSKNSGKVDTDITDSHQEMTDVNEIGEGRTKSDLLNKESDVANDLEVASVPPRSPDEHEKNPEESINSTFEKMKGDEDIDLVSQTNALINEMKDLADALSSNSKPPERMDLDNSIELSRNKNVENLTNKDEINIAVDDKTREKTADDIDKIANEMYPMETD